MANEKNLLNGVPHQFKSGEDAVKAAKKSADVRRAKRDAKKVANMVLGMKPELSEKSARQVMGMGYKQKSSPDILALGMIAIANKAIAGDVKAFEFLLKTAGQSLESQVLELQVDEGRNRMKEAEMDDGFIDALKASGSEVFAEDDSIDEPADLDI